VGYQPCESAISFFQVRTFPHLNSFSLFLYTPGDVFIVFYFRRIPISWSPPPGKGSSLIDGECSTSLHSILFTDSVYNSTAPETSIQHGFTTAAPVANSTAHLEWNWVQEVCFQQVATALEAFMGDNT
jgi:hypothetical protein